VAGNADCQRFRSELPEFLEGVECSFVQQHAQGCAACAALLADLQLIRHEAAELPLEEPSPAVWAGIQQALAAGRQPASVECMQFAEALPGYLEGEHTPRIATHAAECIPCGSLLADLELLRQESAALPPEDPSPAMWARIKVSMAAATTEREAVTAGCRRFHAELADHLEGGSRPFVLQHSTECPYCATSLSDLELLRAESRALPHEEVSPVVWANVRARLDAEGIIRASAPGWRQWFAFPRPAYTRTAAGMLAALAILGVVVLAPWHHPTKVPNSPVVTDVSAVAIPGIDQNLVKTVSDMEASFRIQENSFAPSLKETYDKGLQSLNDSINECAKSVREDPGNTMARDYLVAAYTQKAQLISSAMENYAR
jgi:hypothetical protein